MRSLDQIVGLPVITADAKNIGIVKDVSISTEDWKVKAIQVSQKKRILQMLSESMFISSADIQALSDTVMLDIPADELTNSIQ